MYSDYIMPFHIHVMSITINGMLLVLASAVGCNVNVRAATRAT